jgi:AbrB family looped-hinge helix DNA binding protein
MSAYRVRHGNDRTLLADSSIQLEKFSSLLHSKEYEFQMKWGMEMATATLTSKGQVTIPAAVRTALGLDTGSRIEFVETGKGQFSIIAATSPVQALKGILRKPAKPVSLDDMEHAIAMQGMRK